MALAGGCSLAVEISDAQKIDASPVRVHGVVDRVVQVKGGADIRVSYQVGGQRFATEDLPVLQGVGRTTPTVGTSVCLEVSAEHPESVRVCGQRYPGGDDMIPTLGLVAAAGTVGVVMAAGWIVVATQQKRRDNRGSGSAVDST
ncbi:hypothetical protein [Streptomyces sp. NBC_01718]|uniref:hypothetical protein n=1 Tax=Streptomyces sp. NBC_01718 TaxID=2975919 RepID=UPI00352C396D